MTKTIKEMANEYAHNRYSVRSNILFASECYEDGANAVLGVIEKCLSYDNLHNARRKEYIQDEVYWKLRQIKDRIKELKGL